MIPAEEDSFESFVNSPSLPPLSLNFFASATAKYTPLVNNTRPDAQTSELKN